MKDFKSNSDQSPSGEKTGETQKAGGQQMTGAVDILNAFVKAFGGKSEGEIWKSILAQAEQGKRDGTLTNDDLDNFYATLAPLLDGFKRQKLKSVINKLKAI